MADSIVAAVRAEVARQLRVCALPKDATLLVAVSGGQDSVCLLDALAAVAPGARLVVFHLDHALRGQDSARDAEAVRALATGYGLEVVVRRVDVLAYAQRQRLGLEEAGRYARYQLLLAEAVGRQAWGAAVGHTADDQGESQLMHLLRGSGLPGLSGMSDVQHFEARLLGPPLAGAPVSSAARELRVFRPLLATRRAATARYCRELALPIRPDPTNLDPIHLRNRVRHHLMPVLESYNPSIVASLDRLAQLAADDELELERLADETWARLAEPAENSVEFGWPDWRALGKAIQRRLLRKAQQHLRPEASWSFQSLESARLLLARETPRRRLALGGGIVLNTDRSGFQVARSAVAAGTAAEPALEGEAP